MLTIGFIAFAFDAVVHGRQEIARSGELILALASTAFAYDVIQDIKTRGYRLPQLRL